MLYIYGCGGHAKSVADALVFNGEQSIIFIDDNAKNGEMVLGFPVLKKPNGPGKAIIALGNNQRRAKVFESLDPNRTISVIAKTAYVSPYTKINTGVFVGYGAYIGPNVVIGAASIINTRSIIEHDCVIGNYCHISINATIAGKCQIGHYVMISAGATVIDGVTICDNVIVGAGAVVVKDILEAGTYVGVPTKKI